MTGPAALRHQHAVLNGSLAPGRPWLDLALQVTNIALSLAPVALVIYLLARSGERASAIGLDLRTPGTDVARGMVLAAVIGGSGLLLYLAAFHIGVNLNVVPEALPAAWWRIPVLIASAAQNGILEESVVLGYLLHRLDQLGWPARACHRGQRGVARLVSPVPGVRRFRGQRRNGRHLRCPLPPLGQGDADDHRAHPHRLGRVRRLRRAAWPGLLAAVIERLEHDP